MPYSSIIHLKSYSLSSGILVSGLGFLFPLPKLAIAVFLFITIDFGTGVWASLKRKEVFESKKGWCTVYKLLFAELAIMLTYIFQTWILSFQELHLPNIVAAFICGVELWSFLENASYISNHPLFNALKNITKRKIDTAIENSTEYEQQ